MLGLSRDEQDCLLELARQAMATAVQGTQLDLPAWGARFPSAQLHEPSAAFVTLYQQGHLRGCVGSVQRRKALYLTVADCAVSAALHDPRFAPVTASELPQLRIEISVLSPLFPIQPEEVKLGEHGLLVTQGFRRGLLLPRLALEYGWNRERFLEETCAKAGLARDAWKKGARLEAFTAFVFSEAARA